MQAGKIAFIIAFGMVGSLVQIASWQDEHIEANANNMDSFPWTRNESKFHGDQQISLGQWTQNEIFIRYNIDIPPIIDQALL